MWKLFLADSLIWENNHQICTKNYTCCVNIYQKIYVIKIRCRIINGPFLWNDVYHNTHIIISDFVMCYSYTDPIFYALGCRNTLHPSLGFSVTSLSTLKFWPGTRSQVKVWMNLAKITLASIWKRSAKDLFVLKQNKTQNKTKTKQNKKATPNPPQAMSCIICKNIL